MNYQIADFIIRIKNAVMARRQRVALPYSKKTLAIGKVLQKEGFLKDIQEETMNRKKALVANFIYRKRDLPLSNVLIVSKPSLRVYIGATDIAEREKKELHTLILSTSKGIMSGKEAKKLEIGGELLFEIW